MPIHPFIPYPAIGTAVAAETKVSPARKLIDGPGAKGVDQALQDVYRDQSAFHQTLL